MQVVIEADVAAAAAMYDGIIRRAEDPRPLLSMLADSMREYEVDVFATGGHGTWAANSPATLEAKGGGQVLVDHGDLMRDLTSGADLSGEDVELVTDQPYAGYLRDGARGMPKRDPAPLPSGTVVEGWAQAALGYLVHGRLR